MTERWCIKISGRVQGVGFRPGVVRLARQLQLTGNVCNDLQGVTIELQGEPQPLAVFIDRLCGVDKPPLAEIQSCQATPTSLISGESQFLICHSQDYGVLQSEVAVDTAVCPDCLVEMADPMNFRYQYPFINCTNCGPRYSIVKTIPYDRPNTTMARFSMCRRCAGQYGDVGDRRFHAQPVACPTCGPQVWLTDARGERLANEGGCFTQAATLLKEGKIVAIKGIGGFHLAVNALDETAVQRLRQRKHRDHKPFALMTDSLAKMKRFVEVDAQAEALLQSPESPIVLLPRRRACPLAEAVAGDMNTLGFMLCYAPLHVLLFAEGLEVLVMTSGNMSDEPLICDNELALDKLSGIVDAFFMHDRDIHRQVDDSIVHFVNDVPILLRRSRGYMPSPVRLAQSTAKMVLATGADLKNTFCLAKDDQLICSEHIGDLADAEVYRHYLRSIDHLCKLFEVDPVVIVADDHPGYLSTQYGQGHRAETFLTVQHHWAHIAAVLAEHQVDGAVIGLVADGTGYGLDGTIWGGECLIASLEEFERFGHLRPFTLAGGDRASKEAIRPLLGLLSQVYGANLNNLSDKSIVFRIEPDEATVEMICQQLTSGLNCVATSSVGRVFDAVAALLGIGKQNYFDAQLPMTLESRVVTGCHEILSYDMQEAIDGTVQLDLRPLIHDLVTKIQKKQNVRQLPAQFHNTLVKAFLQWALLARERTGLRTVALSGGVMCNRYFAGRLQQALLEAEFTVLMHQRLPANDGCISVGQAAIACRSLG
ncbi:carbamoyltransferase HypF [Planctomycetota bacterium]